MNIIARFANLFNRLCKYKTLDTSEAARVISINTNKTYAVGILEDWNSTHSVIFKDGKTVPNVNPQITSAWGTPVLYVIEDNFFIALWKYSSDVVVWSNHQTF